MRGRSGLFFAIAAVALIAMVLAVIDRRPKREPTRVASPIPTEITRVTEPMMYCVDKNIDTPRGRVQVLVDSSGSMDGVRGPVISYVRWLEQSVSRLRDSAIGIDEFRIATFDRTSGFVAFSGVPAFTNAYRPHAQTTLHEAIRASREWDLTFILTDGVAAAGAGSGDCAGGVDAACVARALREAVYVERTSSAASLAPGVWVVPLWTRHQGVFYSERPLSVTEFDREASLESIHRELEQDISITRPRSDRDGNLMFDYSGPRALMLIVIAHSESIGRSAIVALRERMAENNVAAVSSTRGERAPLGAFPALELYPGYLPPQEWTALTEDGNAVPRGTMDVDFVERRRITLACQAQTLNEAKYLLASRSKRTGTRCAPIYQLPPFELGFLGAGGTKGDDLGGFVAEMKRRSTTEGEEFALTLVCGQQQARPCLSDPLRQQWVARPRYDQAGDGEAVSSSHNVVNELTTTDLTQQPHRLYGFESVISYFFDEVAKDHRQIVLADLEICNQAGPQ